MADICITGKKEGICSRRWCTNDNNVDCCTQCKFKDTCSFVCDCVGDDSEINGGADVSVYGRYER